MKKGFVPSDTDRTIAEKIKLRRLLLGMTQSDLAKNAVFLSNNYKNMKKQKTEYLHRGYI